MNWMFPFEVGEVGLAQRAGIEPASTEKESVA